MIVQMPLDVWGDRGSEVYLAAKAMILACGDELLEPNAFDGVRGGVLFHRDMPRYKPQKPDSRTTTLIKALPLARNTLALTLPPFREGIRKTLKDRYARICLNGFWWDDADHGLTFREGPERLQMICDEQGITIKPPKQMSEKRALIVLQKHNDGSVRTDMQRWARWKAVAYKERGYKVIARVHPSPPEDRIDLPVEVQRGLKVPLVEALDWASIVVAHTSTTAVEAVVHGIRVDTDPGNLAAPVSAWPPCREQWLKSLAHCQWKYSEMQSGLPWRHLRERMPHATT